MITTFTLIQPVESPEATKIALEAALTASGVVEFTTYLQRVDVTGYFFAIEAEEVGSNLRTLQGLCGTLNTKERGRIGQSENLRDVGRFWQVAGGEGRFAREHPTPPDAK
jgi:hypothetical protein